MDWLPYTWETGAVHSVEVEEYVRRKKHKDVFVIHEEGVVPSLHGRFTHADAEGAYLRYRGSPESMPQSRHSPALSPVLFGLEDVYGDNLDEDWEVDAKDGGVSTSSRWKELQYKLDRYRHVLIERD